MSEVFSQEYHVRWSDLDPNFHVKHTSYADLCATVRTEYLEFIGMGIFELGKLKIGPVLFSEYIQYRNEIRPSDKIIVNVAIGGLSDDGRKFRMCHEIFRKSDGALAATLEIKGAWFDLEKRKVTVPPQFILEKMSTLPRSKDFVKI